MEQICIYRNGFPKADSPISTDDTKRVYINTMSDLAYIKNGRRSSLVDYPNHLIMGFDLTCTQQASHDFIHPELTIWFNAESFKKSYLNKLMDEDN